jgi:hypothetical protein
MVTSEPKELAYLTLDSITAHYSKVPSKRCFDLSIKGAQIDNQLR